jgi:O-antigen ligase
MSSSVVSLARPGTRIRVPLGRIVTVLSCVVIAAAPLRIVVPYLGGPYAIEVLLAAIALIGTPWLISLARQRTLDTASTAGVLFVCGQVVSTVAHPSSEGVATVLAFLAVVVLIAVATRLQEREATRLFRVVLAWCAFEAVLSAGQSIFNRGFGLRMFGELANPLRESGGAAVPLGFQWHQYMLGSVALLAGTLGYRELKRSAAWCVVGISSMTFLGVVCIGRSVLLGVLTVLVALLCCVFRRPEVRRTSLIALAFAAIAVVPAYLITQSGYEGRAERAKSDFTTARTDLVRQGLAVFLKHPIVGVGTAQYLPALEADLEIRARLPRVALSHNIVTHIAAESGVVGLLAGLPLLVVIVHRMRRRFLESIPFVVFLAPCMFDLFHYNAYFLHEHAMVHLGVALAVGFRSIDLGQRKIRST